MSHREIELGDLVRSRIEGIIGIVTDMTLTDREPIVTIEYWESDSTLSMSENGIVLAPIGRLAKYISDYSEFENVFAPTCHGF